MITESDMECLRSRVAKRYMPSKTDFAYVVRELDETRNLLKSAGVVSKRGASKTECVWREDEDGNWETDCGGMHTFIEGCPYQNRHAFCPYCGRALIGVPNA